MCAVTAPDDWTVRDWFKRLLSGKPHQIIGGPGDPYLKRWYLIPRNTHVNFYLHQFLRSDDDRALHDHPWWFVSAIVRGEYVEITERGRKWRGAGSIAFRPAEWRHRVKLVDELVLSDGVACLEPKSCWTLIITGPRSRRWGFWCRNKPEGEQFIHWKEFGDAGCGEGDTQ